MNPEKIIASLILMGFDYVTKDPVVLSNKKRQLQIHIGSTIIFIGGILDPIYERTIIMDKGVMLKIIEYIEKYEHKRK